MRALGAALGLLFLFVASPAGGYVRASNKTGKAVYWKSGCVFLTPSAGGSKDLGEAATLVEIQRSIDNWLNATAACSFLELHLEPVGTNQGTSNDAANRITWLEDRWGAGNGNDFVPYDRQAAALTTLRFVESAAAANNGEIVDADIELNGVNFTYVAAASAGGRQTDVQNTLTHELGHLIGLDHTCDDGARSPAPKDSMGNAVPRCFGMLPAALTDATMYNFADPGETKKRTPEADDIAGYCGIYPKAMDPNACAPVSRRSATKGCAAGGGDAAGGLALALFLVLLSRRRQGEGIWCLAPRGAGRSVRRSNETT